MRFAPDGEPPGPTLHYHIDDFAIAQSFGVALPGEMADLVDVTGAVYVADRLSRRHPDHADRYHPHWTRHIAIRLPLRNPARWSQPSLAERLRKLLWFLTDDVWHFEFVPRSVRPRVSETVRFLFSPPLLEPVTVALFSGGLDSLAGACRELLDHPAGSLVLVSGNTNPRIGALQERLTHGLKQKSQRHILPVEVQFGLRGRGGQYDKDEWTQRSRGFIFPVLGAVASLLAGTDHLAIYEPGIGAINLPYTEAQLGAQSTRATDPRTLAALSNLITLATGRQFEIRAPFLFATKAELCCSILELGLSDLATQTLSCDSVSLRVANHTHCGLCTSCLLRRQALDAVGLGDLDARCNIYLRDVMSTGLRFEKLHNLRAMDYQAAQLDWALHQAQSWRELSRMYPQLIEIVASLAGRGHGSMLIETQLISLYRRYSDEWARFRSRLPITPAA
ncbi:MAG: 7-cyano-7-deazaguanine synthase [Chloroflexi bacterium]|nr:7-cyano-7-deazaguanine synthase [Chloroflexota bacterium]